MGGRAQGGGKGAQNKIVIFLHFFIKLFCYIKIKYYICSTEMNQLTLKITTMFNRKFNTQREATEYYGHSWNYIERHYHVSRCYDSSGFRGYFINKN